MTAYLYLTYGSDSAATVTRLDLLDAAWPDEDFGVSGELGMSRLTTGRTRSVSPENLSGAKGAGGAATEGTVSIPTSA